MIMMGRIVQVVFIFCIASLIGCEEDSKPFKVGKQAKLNISGASGVVVYNENANNGGRIATQGTNLYKITEEGSIEQVKFVYEDGTETDPNAIDQIRVDDFYNVNHNYFVLEGHFSAWDTLGNYVGYSALLVRKNDGAIFDFKPHYTVYNGEVYPISGDIGRKFFFEDNVGNFYYLNGAGIVIKIDVSNPDKLFRTEYLPSGQSTTQFAVDIEGNCIYKTNEGFRLRKKSGGIFDFQTEGVNINQFWRGVNGKIYFSAGPTISVLNVEDGEVSWNSVASDPYLNIGSGYYKIDKSNSVVFISLYNHSHWEFFEESNQLVQFDLPDLSWNTKIIYSDNYYYLSEGVNLYKVSLEDHSFENILDPGKYEVYTMSADNDDNLQISALRFSDGKKIIAEINAQNELTIIDEEQDKEAIYLQRLN